MKPSEIRDMDHQDLEETLEEFQQELMHERGVAAMGGAPPNPGRISYLRRTIARMKTIAHERSEETDERL